MARLTGLEPATFGVTGRHSNRLSYNRAAFPLGTATIDVKTRAAHFPVPAPLPADTITSNP